MTPFLKSQCLLCPRLLIGWLCSTTLQIVLISKVLRPFALLLGVDVDEMPGNKKSAKVRELLMYFERRKQLSEFSQVWVNFKESKY